MDITSAQAAPDFALQDQLGSWFRLSDRNLVGPTVLVFVRGHWCPYCRRYLQKLASRYSEVVERGSALLAISPEPVLTSASFARELNLPFPILADTDGAVIDLYQTRNRLTASRAMMPHPSVFVIDKQGMICFRSIDRDFRRRTTVRSILHVLDDIASPQARSIV
jgi:peroxiredoxin